MFGLLYSLIFGGACLRSFIDDDEHEKQRRKNARQNHSSYYTDKNGRFRHTDSNKKFTTEDIHNTFFSHEHDIAIEKMSYKKLLKERPMIDPEWYTFEDFLINKYRNDRVTGKQKYPEIDWDNLPEPKGYRKPIEYFWCVCDLNHPKTPYYVFETENEAKDYAINILHDNRFFLILREITKENVYKGINMFNCPQIYIMKDGTIYTNDKEENE